MVAGSRHVGGLDVSVARGSRRSVARPGGKEVVFAIRQQDVDSTLAFVIQTISAMLDARRDVSRAKSTIKIVTVMAGQHGTSVVADVIAAQFFDTALTVTLEAVGDVAMHAAVTELRLAAAAGSPKDKARHRLLADAHLGTVYSAAKKRADKRRLLDLTDAPFKAHQEAAVAAILKAMISHEAKLEATGFWVDAARDHFRHYETRHEQFRRSHDQLTALHGQLQRGSSWFVRDPLGTAGPQGQTAWLRRSTAIAKVAREESRVGARVAAGDRVVGQFSELCTRLSPR